MRWVLKQWSGVRSKNSRNFPFVPIIYPPFCKDSWCLYSPSTAKVGFTFMYAFKVEKTMAPHSSTLAWKIPWMEEPGGLQSMGSLSRTWLNDFTFTFHFHALEKEMATLSSVLAWRIPGTGSQVGAVYGVAQSQTRLKRLSSSSSTHLRTANIKGIWEDIE